MMQLYVKWKTHHALIGFLADRGVDRRVFQRMPPIITASVRGAYRATAIGRASH